MDGQILKKAEITLTDFQSESNCISVSIINGVIRFKAYAFDEDVEVVVDLDLEDSKILESVLRIMNEVIEGNLEKMKERLRAPAINKD